MCFLMNLIFLKKRLAFSPKVCYESEGREFESLPARHRKKDTHSGILFSIYC